MSVTTVLREAKNEVMPYVAELAPWLLHEEDIIREELRKSIAVRGVDPDSVPEHDLNKLERYTDTGYLISQQRRMLVDGEGDEAHFKQPCSKPDDDEDRDAFFGWQLSGYLDESASRLERSLTAGADREHAWYPALSRRYTGLGRRARELAPKILSQHKVLGVIRRRESPIPKEGVYLWHALRSQAFIDATLATKDLVCHKIREPEERLCASHDLVPSFMLSTAGMHFLDVIIDRSFGELAYDIVKHPVTGRYILRMDTANRRLLFPKYDGEYPNTTLKCPAHAVSREDAAISGVRADSNLAYLAHAAVNLAFDVGLMQ